MHIANIIFSNLSIVLTIICLILKFIKKSWNVLNIITVFVILISIIIRVLLEMGAIKGSTKLVREIVSKEETDDVKLEDILESEKYIKKHTFLAILGMIKDKLIMLIITLMLII